MDQRETTPPDGPDAGAPPEGGAWSEDWDWSRQYTPPHGRPPMPDFSALYALLDSLRRLIPPELQEQFSALQRELLLTLRGLIDWQLERLEAGPRPSEVEDIPIE
jgi:hypothetical protein